MKALLFDTLATTRRASTASRCSLGRRPNYPFWRTADTRKHYDGADMVVSGRIVSVRLFGDPKAGPSTRT